MLPNYRARSKRAHAQTRGQNGFRWPIFLAGHKHKPRDAHRGLLPAYWMRGLSSTRHFFGNGFVAGKNRAKATDRKRAVRTEMEARFHLTKSTPQHNGRLRETQGHQEPLAPSESLLNKGEKNGKEMELCLI